MGSGGLQFDGGDGFSAVRGNQKSCFVGTGTQIAAISPTYAGQLAFATSTTGGFTIDTLYERNAANNAWNSVATFYTTINETAEVSTTPVTDNASFTTTAGNRYYAFFTLPTTEKFYLITGIEWKNAATISGNVQAGVDVIDANPPTLASTPLIALVQEVAQAGANVVQRVSIISSTLIRGGTICGAWVSCSSGTATIREETGLGSQNQQKATAYSATPATSENTAWTAATARKYLKVYHRGYF